MSTLNGISEEKLGEIILNRPFPSDQIRACLHDALERNEQPADVIGIKVINGIMRPLTINEWLEDCATIESVINKILISKWEYDGIKYKPNIGGIRERKLIAISFLVIALRTYGQFLYDKKKTLYYYDSSSEQIFLLSSDEFGWRFIPTALIDDIKKVKNQLGKDALIYGDEVELYRNSHYDTVQNILYFYDTVRYVFKIQANKPIELIKNGTDGVYFLTTPSKFPFEIVPIPEDDGNVVGQLVSFPMSKGELKKQQEIEERYGSKISALDLDYMHHAPKDRLWQKYFARRVNFQPSNMSLHMKNILFDAFMLLTPFRELFPNRPITAMMGEKGSGKSALLKRVACFFTGNNSFGLIKMPETLEDFNSITTTENIAYFDNVDTFIKWLPDALATATGCTASMKRKLYTDNEVISYVSKAWCGITSRTGDGLRRDDIADRTFIYYVRRYIDFIPEAQLDEFLINPEQRNIVFSSMMQDIQKIVNLLATHKSIPNLITRMADCSQIIYRIATEIFGYSEMFTRDLFNRLAKETAWFSIEKSPFSSIIPSFLALQSKFGQEEWSAGEIYKWITVYNAQCDESDKIDLPFKNLIGFSTGLDKVSTELRTIYNITRIKQKRGWKYFIKEAYGLGTTGWNIYAASGASKPVYQYSPK